MARRYDTWFDTSWGAHAWAVETRTAPAALGPIAGRTVADAVRLPLDDASVDAAITVATVEFTGDAGAVLTEMVGVTRPGRRVAAVLNPTSLWGLPDRPARHDPYARGRFPNRAELLRLGRRNGRTRLAGALFTAGRLPRCGAVQILTVEVGR